MKKVNRNEFNDDWFWFHFSSITSTLKLIGSLNNGILSVYEHKYRTPFLSTLYSCSINNLYFYIYQILKDGETDRQTDRQTNKQTDRQTDRQIDRQTDRQRQSEKERERSIYVFQWRHSVMVITTQFNKESCKLIQQSLKPDSSQI